MSIYKGDLNAAAIYKGDLNVIDMYIGSKKIFSAMKELTATGYPLTLNKSVGKYLKDYKIYGNSVQDGTPTPEAPVEVVSVGEYDSETGKYKVPVVARGKNLLPYPYYYDSRTLRGITITVNDDGTIILNGTGEFDTARIVDFYLLYKSDISAGTYTLSGCPTGGGTYSYRLFVTVHNYYSDGKPRYYNDIGGGTSIDVKENCTITIAIRIGDEIGTVDNFVFKPQLELGTTATDYEPYHAPITTNLYLDEPLRKVGDYADYVDFGKGEVVRNAKELELTSTNLYWSAYIFEAGSFYGFSSALSSMLSGNRQAGFCTHLQNIIGGAYTSPIWFGVNSNRLFVSFPDIYNSAETDAERITAFKAYLTAQAEAGTPVKVTYILAEPTRTPISIPKLPTIKGTCIIEADTNIKPSSMEATYYGRN